jgi:hypothetical protein
VVSAPQPPSWLPLGERVGTLRCGDAMKIERGEEEWKLTHDGGPVAILRPWLGCYYVYLSDQSHERPLGPFRSMLEAIRHVQPSKPKHRRLVYLRGTLTRRSEDESE